MSLEGGMGLGGGLLARLGRARSIGCPSDGEFDRNFDLQASLTSKFLSNSPPSQLLRSIIAKTNLFGKVFSRFFPVNSLCHGYNRAYSARFKRVITI